ncbi:hypothetical protein SUGI_0493230 [Cryptomeria japonica]|nr:hypothetical protein SUGI_0493230 [Cryptomeria japonica]
MENMQDITHGISCLFAAQDATESFDKEALVHQHEIAIRRYAHLREETAAGNLVTSYMTVAEPRPGAPMVSV